MAVLFLDCCVLELGCVLARLVSGLPAEAVLQPAAPVVQRRNLQVLSLWHYHWQLMCAHVWCCTMQLKSKSTIKM